MDASDQGAEHGLQAESVPRFGEPGQEPLSDEDRARGIRGRSVGYHTHDGLTWEPGTRCFVCRAAATPRPSASADLAESVARTFHQVYEDRAPAHGYETRRASAVQWEHVPANNRALMVEVAGEVVRRFGFVMRADLVRWLREQVRVAAGSLADNTELGEEGKAIAGGARATWTEFLARKLEQGEAP